MNFGQSEALFKLTDLVKTLFVFCLLRDAPHTLEISGDIEITCIYDFAETWQAIALIWWLDYGSCSTDKQMHLLNIFSKTVLITD